MILTMEKTQTRDFEEKEEATIQSIESRIAESRNIIHEDDTHDLTASEMMYFLQSGKKSYFYLSEMYDLIYKAFLLGFDSGRHHEREV